MGTETTPPGLEFRPFEPGHADAVLALWNESLGLLFPLRPELFQQNALDDTNYRPGDHAVAVLERRLVGFVLTKRWRVDAPGVDRATGSIAALAVAPAARRRGIGTALTRWAEERLRSEGCRRVRLGAGGFLHFLPGVPVELRSFLAFFPGRGYALGPEVYDLATDLAGYAPRPGRPAADVGPARPEEAGELLGFLEREFPGVWTYTVRWLLGQGKPIDEIVLLRQDGRVGGFCVTYPPGARPIGPSVAWCSLLAQPAGGLGPIGVGAALRGRGLGTALLDGALRRLADAGVRGCAIDGTTRLDFFARAGFTPWKAYLLGEKALA